MRKITFILISLIMILSACTTNSDGTNSQAPDSSLNTKEIVEQILSEYGLSGGSTFSSFSETYGEYLDSDLVLAYYGDMGEVPDMESVTEYCVYIDGSDPNLQKELGVFKLKPDADAELFISFMRSRIAAMLENAKNYPSVDTEPLENAEFFIDGEYVAYVAVKSDGSKIAKFIKDSIK